MLPRTPDATSGAPPRAHVELPDAGTRYRLHLVNGLVHVTELGPHNARLPFEVLLFLDSHLWLEILFGVRSLSAEIRKGRVGVQGHEDFVADFVERFDQIDRRPGLARSAVRRRSHAKPASTGRCDST